MKLVLTPRLPEEFPPGYQIRFDRVLRYTKVNDRHEWSTEFGLHMSIHDSDVLYIEVEKSLDSAK